MATKPMTSKITDTQISLKRFTTHACLKFYFFSSISTSHYTAPITAASFIHHPPHHARPRNHYSSSHQWHRQQHNVHAPTDDLISGSSNTPSSSSPTTTTTTTQTEIWLDLRGTAIAPRAALEYINDEILNDDEDDGGNERSDDDNIVVHRVLISKDNAETAKRNFRQGIDPDIYVVDRDDKMISLMNDEEREMTTGDVFFLEKGGGQEALSILECVEEGRWALIEGGRIRDDEERRDAVKNAVDFLGTVMNAPRQLNDGLFIIGEDGNGSLQKRNTNIRGGIALTCGSNEDVFNYGAYLQASLSSSAASLVTSEEGILYNVVGSECDDVASTAVRSAIVLPFDAMIWKTAAFVFGDEEDFIDDDDDDKN